MSNALKKLWPYLLALGVLFAVAWWGDSLWPDRQVESIKQPEEQDTIEEPVVIKVDTLQQKKVAQEDSIYEKEAEERLWHVVVGSVKDQGDAEKYAASLEASDVKVRYVEYLDTYRVVYGSYSSIRHAQDAYRKIEASYPEAWLVYF